MSKTFRWVPRILTIVYIIFISIFALDSFAGDASTFTKIGGFLIHLIPSFLMLGVLVYSWNKPLVGGILFLTLGVLSVFWWRTYRIPLYFALLSLPMLTNGLLFVYSHFRDRPDDRKITR